MVTTKVRVRRSVAEKRRIVELTLQPGQSVSRVAQAEGVNLHQVFDWLRAYRAGELVEAGGHASSLLPVILSAAGSAGVIARQQTVCPKTSSPSGAIHIEMPGRATISVESGADAVTLRAVLEIRIAEHPINRIDELLPWNLADDLQPVAKAAWPVLPEVSLKIYGHFADRTLPKIHTRH